MIREKRQFFQYSLFFFLFILFTYCIIYSLFPLESGSKSCYIKDILIYEFLISNFEFRINIEKLMIENTNKKEYDLETRTSAFGERCILMCRKIKQDTITK